MMRLEEIQDPRQLERLENFKKEQETILMQNLKQHYSAVKSELKYTKKLIASESARARGFEEELNLSGKRKLKHNKGQYKHTVRFLEHLKQSLSKLHEERRLFQNDIKCFEHLVTELEQHLNTLQKQIQVKKKSLQKIQYKADESLVGETCCVCLEDIEVGRNMVRLSCNCKEFYCNNCIEEWTVLNNSCPTCRYKFI